MSHVNTMASTLSGIDVATISAAVEAAATALDGKVVKGIETGRGGSRVNEWQGKPIIAAVQLPNHRYAVGVTRDAKGSPTFVGYEATGFGVAAFQREVEMGIKLIEYANVMKEEGYDIETAEVKGHIVLKCEKE